MIICYLDHFGTFGEIFDFDTFESVLVDRHPHSSMNCRLSNLGTQFQSPWPIVIYRSDDNIYPKSKIQSIKIVVGRGDFYSLH